MGFLEGGETPNPKNRHEIRAAVRLTLATEERQILKSEMPHGRDLDALGVHPLAFAENTKTRNEEKRRRKARR